VGGRLRGGRDGPHDDRAGLRQGAGAGLKRRPRSGAAVPLPDLHGRTVVITGANTGIGLETAAALAGAGATVVLACRNLDKAKDAKADIEVRHPAAAVELLRLDLADQAMIADAAAETLDRFERIDRLVNNAGVMGIPRTLTADGFEMVFGTNHLGHFAYTGRVLPALLATPASRVVTVSSMSHRLGRIRWDDLRGERSYGKARAYAQSKLANLLFAFELQRRLVLGGADTISVAAHPGFAATDIVRRGDGSAMGGGRSGGPPGARFVQSPADAARSSLRAATAPGVYGGQYFGPGGRGGLSGPAVPVPPARRALDADDQRRLWELSVELTAIDYPLPAD
jgi:NAD(P)-dependent dehydrogenase (short-subunit alcohol dehydrogenase family)